MKNKIMLALVVLAGIVNAAHADNLEKSAGDANTKSSDDVSSNDLATRLKSRGLVQMGVGQDPTNCTGIGDL